MGQLNDFSVFTFTETGGIYSNGWNIFKSVLQGGFSILQYVGVIVSVMAVIISACYLMVYSRKPKELAEHAGLFGENVVTIVFIAGLVGIIASVAQMNI